MDARTPGGASPAGDLDPGSPGWWVLAQGAQVLSVLHSHGHGCCAHSPLRSLPWRQRHLVFSPLVAPSMLNDGNALDSTAGEGEGDDDSALNQQTDLAVEEDLFMAEVAAHT